MAETKNLLEFPETNQTLSSSWLHVSEGGVDKKISLDNFLTGVNGGNPFSISVKEESSSARTLTIGDKNSYIRCLSAVQTTVTVNNASTSGWKRGDSVIFRKEGAGDVLFSNGSGVIIRAAASGVSLTEAGQVGQLLCVDDTPTATVFDLMTGGNAGSDVRLSISNFADDVAAAAAYAASSGIKISLERRTITAGALPSNAEDYFFDGCIKVSGICYPINFWTFSKSTIMTQDQGQRLNYNAWPQGKVYKQRWNGPDNQSTLKLLVNRGPDHISSGLGVWSMESQDNFNSLSEPTLESGSYNGYSGGVTCWSAGTDGTRQYFITRQRGASYNIGSTAHVLNYSSDPLGDAGYSRKTIFFNDGVEVPVEFHSFAQLGNGKLAVGYHYTSGEVGLAITSSDSTVGDTWARTVMYPVGSDFVEPSVLYDPDNDVTVGFLRTQSLSSRPKFYISRDNGSTFEFYTVQHVPLAACLESPINIAHADGKYYGFVTERTGDARMYLLVADAAEAAANGASAFEIYFVGNSKYYGPGASGAGAGDLWAGDGRVSLFYGEHGYTQESVNVVKMDVDFSGKNELKTTVLQKEHFMDLTSMLNPAWSADDSLEGASVNGGGLYAYKRGGKLRIVGQLKTSDASQDIINLPHFLEPWSSKKGVIVHGDNDFSVIFCRGKQSSGSAGQLVVVGGSGALTKVAIDLEIDLIR